MNIEDPWSSLHEEARLHEDYIQGCRYLAAGDFPSAASCFRTADGAAGPEDVYTNVYGAALGYSQVLLHDVSGLNLCRSAGRAEQHNADVFEYLAKAELRMQHRKQACEAIARGLRVDRAHRGLRHLREQMGIRRAPVLGFLSRDNLLNRILGRMTYQKAAGQSKVPKK